MKRQFVLGAALLVCASAKADVRLPAFFGDNMVLQQGVSAPVWGWADAGEKVTVKIGNQVKETTAGADGSWTVKLDPLPVSENAVLQVNGKNAIAINNVAVGEVWLASGQSNMEFTLRGASNAQEAIAASSDPLLRSFNVAKATSDTPKNDVKGKWQVAGPDTAGGFSAVGYFFARELRKRLNVPVGLIHSSWGGTPAEAWTSRPSLDAETDFAPMMQRWDKMVADSPAALDKYKNETLVQWEAERQKAKDAGQPEPAKPKEPVNQATSQNRPANLYNAMIAPLVPYAMRGAIWYQGESNSGRAYQYRKLLPAMIADWRGKWGVAKPEDYGFYVVQLANFMAEKPEPGESSWAELRDAQTYTANMPGNGQGLAIDIGEAGDIHPKNKQDVGIRLALSALAKTYGQAIEYSGPIYDSMTKDGNKIRLKFTHADGLIVKSAQDRKLNNAAPDSEVPRGHWAYDAMSKLYKSGIVEGIPGVEAFQGDKAVNRYEFSVATARLWNSLQGKAPATKFGELTGLYNSLVQEFLPELRKLGVPVGDAQGFAIAGEDHKWKWAQAKIEGSEIVVWNDEIANPITVRYAWADNPKATIYNAAGLPAVPFRTDDWPMVTLNNK